MVKGQIYYFNENDDFETCIFCRKTPLVNNRVYIHVHAVIYSVTFNYFTYVCRNKSPTGLML